MAESEATIEDSPPDSPEIALKNRGKSLNVLSSESSPKTPRLIQKSRSLDQGKAKGGGAPNPLPATINQAILKFQRSYKKKNEDFHLLFPAVTEAEILVDDYSCAIQKDILLQGRMYLTAESFFFYSNVFGYETRLALKCTEVSAIHKAKTALVFPNAIELYTTNDIKYGFSSFISRDASYHVMFKVWQNALLEMPMCASELLHYARQTWGDPSVDEEEETDIDKEGYTFEILEFPKQASVDSTESANSLPRNSSRNSNSEGSYDGPLADPIGRQFLCEEFPFSAENLFNMVFSKSSLSQLHMSERKALNLNWGQWEEKTREFSYTLPLNATFGPKSVDVIETQTLLEDSQPGVYYNLSSEVTNKNIPFADSFYILVQYCVWQTSPQKSVLRVCCEVHFTKSVWIKGAIEKNAMKGTENQLKLLSKNLHDVKQPVSAAQPVRIKTSPRRPSIFSLKKPSKRPGSRLPTVEQRVQPESRNCHSFLLLLILLSLIFLISFNGFLYYRFFSYRHALDPLTAMKSVDCSNHELVDILKRQQRFYSIELERWKSIMSVSVDLLSQLKESLEAVQMEILSLTEQRQKESVK